MTICIMIGRSRRWHIFYKLPKRKIYQQFWTVNKQNQKQVVLVKYTSLSPFKVVTLNVIYYTFFLLTLDNRFNSGAIIFILQELLFTQQKFTASSELLSSVIQKSFIIVNYVSEPQLKKALNNQRGICHRLFKLS